MPEWKSFSEAPAAAAAARAVASTHIFHPIMNLHDGRACPICAASGSGCALQHTKALRSAVHFHVVETHFYSMI
jgi:hypothetical protein